MFFHNLETFLWYMNWLACWLTGTREQSIHMKTKYKEIKLSKKKKNNNNIWNLIWEKDSAPDSPIGADSVRS